MGIVPLVSRSLLMRFATWRRSGWRQGSPPVITQRPFTAAWTSFGVSSEFSWWSVSQRAHERLQPAVRMKVTSCPVAGPSPCMDVKISLIFKGLTPGKVVSMLIYR